MRLYRMIGKNDTYGFAEWTGEEPLNLPGLWRPATRTERIYHQLFRNRFSYVDVVGISIAIGVVAALDLPLWALVLITAPLVVIVMFLEKRFR